MAWSDGPLVLGIETSCDETGVGDRPRPRRCWPTRCASSVDEHARFGGVVPEVASRAHLEAMVPDAGAGLRDGRGTLRDVDAIAVTAGPGTGRGAPRRGRPPRRRLAVALGMPRLRRQPPRRPRRRRRARARPAARTPTIGAARLRWALLAAARLRRHRDDAPRSAQTIDDAAGEAFDKVARLLGPALPGRPARSTGWPRTATGDAIAFPRGLTGGQRPGAAPVRLLLLRAQDRGGPLGRGPARRPASRSRSRTSRPRSRRPSCDVLTAQGRRRLPRARRRPPADRRRGGRELPAAGARRGAVRAAGIRLRVPRPGLCTDNGAMVAALGAQLVARGCAVAAGPRRRLLPARGGGAGVTATQAPPLVPVLPTCGSRASAWLPPTAWRTSSIGLSSCSCWARPSRRFSDRPAGSSPWGSSPGSSASSGRPSA